MLVLLAAITALHQAPILTCPLMPVEPVASAGQYDWGGLRIAFCCQGCRNTFESDPGEVVANARKSGRVFALSLFDPVTRTRIEPSKTSLPVADHSGVRFRFNGLASRSAFAESPSSLSKLPPKESTYCFARRAEIGAYSEAKSYADRRDVRFYFDCDECVRRFTEDSESFARAALPATHEIQMYEVKKDDGA